MARINYEKLVHLHESMGPGRAERFLQEAFEAKDLNAKDFDPAQLFEACFGYHEFISCRRDRGYLATHVMEAAGATATNAFKTITQTVINSLVMDSYQSEEFVFSKVIPEKPSNLNGERIPGVTPIGDEAAVVPEGDPYPMAGVTERWQDTPTTAKRGLIVPVTREAIFFDRFNLVADRCSKVGEWYGVNKEKRAIDCLIDENAGAKSAVLGGHRYNYLGNSIATYGDNSGNHDWDNLAATNALVDWTDLDNVEQLANAIVDPDTAEPIVAELTHLVVTKQLEQTAYHILNSTMVSRTTPGFATSANPNGNELANPYKSKYQLLTSRLLASRLATDTDWFLCNPAKALVYIYNWLMEVTQAPANSHEEFHRDIVQQYKVSERGAYYVMQPRLCFKATA